MVAHPPGGVHLRVETPERRPPRGATHPRESRSSCSAIPPRSAGGVSREGRMLSVQNLRVTYRGSILALRDISIELPRGGVLAVLGSNGAGKTTLLRAISGVLGDYSGSVEHGSIKFEGHALLG